jgi:hypothetical protein
MGSRSSTPRSSPKVDAAAPILATLSIDDIAAPNRQQVEPPRCVNEIVTLYVRSAKLARQKEALDNQQQVRQDTATARDLTVQCPANLAGFPLIDRLP